MMLKLKRSFLTPLAIAVFFPMLTGCDLVSSLNPFGGGGETQPTTPQATTSPASPTGQTQAPANTQGQGSPNVPQSENPWYDAVNKAMEAANAVQTAQTQEEWQSVAQTWQQAIALMRQVPQDSPNYQQAQQKVTEYQGYLQYAQKNAKPENTEQPDNAGEASPAEPAESPAQ
ncbi:hypothetical protein PN462_09105 [Spirulina sp. CS-785/01]|uniref:hypothetical protein n=1 Tax=Spirulina sp. CS-785/01 TaxID=3021716 RepID=UPI00232E07B6|nr:hypothetical protein [Spirulina sp. CS-785/01]MDB9313255.1 hypothetical protein [Spirulina sp. CS-785/01]